MRREYHRGENREYRRRKRQRELQIRVLGFCVFTFLLGVLFGKMVFAREKENPKESVRIEERGMGEETLSPEKKTALDEEEDCLTLVNAENPLPEDYQVKTVEIENHLLLDVRAADALSEMLADGRKEGLDFWVCSAYRTRKKQTDLFENKVQRLMSEEGLSREAALEKAKTEVAYPGTSEHQLGLAVDIVARSYQLLDKKQENTKEARWLRENCWRYGFILRYPTGKTGETGVIYEPWHYRYVGKQAAKEMTEEGICLEEYLEGKKDE